MERNIFKYKKMNITANSFFRKQYFADTWNDEQMQKHTMSPKDCIKIMEKYHQAKLKLLGIDDDVEQIKKFNVAPELKYCNKHKWGDCECTNVCRRGLSIT